MILGYVDPGSGELGSKNHDRDERLPSTSVHCEDGILVQCACCEFVLVGAGDREINNSRHVSSAKGEGDKFGRTLNRSLIWIVETLVSDSTFVRLRSGKGTAFGSNKQIGKSPSG